MKINTSQVRVRDRRIEPAPRAAASSSRIAIVLGASVGGCLAARVLADHFDHVIVLDRDDDAALAERYRRGVAQGTHTHGLLAGGREAMEQLLPGFTDRLAAAGAPLVDLTAQNHAYVHGCRMLAMPGDLIGVGASRPLIERTIRSMVGEISNVTVVGGRAAHELLIDRGVVRGVVTRQGGDGPVETWAANLVIDATGRASNLGDWLEAVGYPKPRVDEVVVDQWYTTREFELAGSDPATSFVVAATVESPRSGVLIPQESGRVSVSIGGVADPAPADVPGFLGFAASLSARVIGDALVGARPVGEARRFRYRASVWRRFDRLQRFPEGLLAFGDAICSVNPIYGQGMTLAAREALVLQRELERGTERLASRFFRGAAREIAGPWSLTVGADLINPTVEGQRTLAVRLTNRYALRAARAAQHDPVVAMTIARITNLLDPPGRLLSPRVIRGVLRHGRAPRACDLERERDLLARAA